MKSSERYAKGSRSITAKEDEIWRFDNSEAFLDADNVKQQRE